MNKNKIKILELKGMMNTKIIQCNTDEYYKDISYNEWCTIYNKYYNKSIDYFIQYLEK